MRPRILCAALAAIAATLPAAAAASARNPAPPATPSVVLDADNRISVIDTRRNLPIVRPLRRVWFDGWLQPTLRAVPTPGGYDLHATFTNRTARNQHLGTFVVPAVNIAASATWYDFRRGAEPQPLAHNNAVIRRADHPYPSDLYSPVAVIADDRLAIGASVLYNPLIYQHEVRVVVQSEGYPWASPPPRGSPDKQWVWHVFFKLDGTIAPGKTRTYTLAVRYADPDRWIDTLRPYADYFQQTHGTLAYTRDPMPVRGYSFAQVDKQTPSNPRGFNYGSRRPDQFGFEPWGSYIRSTSLSTGYTRTMIWALSGLHRNDGLNYPSMFATGVDSMGPASSTRGQLRSLRRDGIGLGLWWGRSQQVMEGWHSDHWEFLDPSNPTHVARALAELDAADTFKPAEIGLDAFAYLPVWKAAPWLQTLQEHAPGVRFITEPSACDILHRLAPTWVNGTEVRYPNLLADIVNPGHETWAGVRFDLLGHSLATPMTPDAKRDEVERIIDLGFVPVLFDDAPFPRNLHERTPAETKQELAEKQESETRPRAPVARFWRHPGGR